MQRKYELFGTGLRWEDARRRNAIVGPVASPGIPTDGQRCWLPYAVGDRNANPNATFSALPDPTEPSAFPASCPAVRPAFMIASIVSTSARDVRGARPLVGRRLTWMPALAAVAMAAAACGTKDAADPLQPSGPVGRVRFVNLVTDPSRNPVNALLEGLPFGVNLVYAASTPASLPAPSTAFYSAVLAGDRTIVLKKTADTTVTVATLSVNIAANNDYTVYATGGTGGSAVTAFSTADANTPPAAGQARIRVTNMSPAAGAVDVFITAANADLAAATPVATGLANRAVVRWCIAGAGDVSDPHGAGGYGAGGARGGGELDAERRRGRGREWSDDRHRGCAGGWHAASVVCAERSVALDVNVRHHRRCESASGSTRFSRRSLILPVYRVDRGSPCLARCRPHIIWCAEPVRSRENSRELMDRLAHDVRIALRGFRRTPAFTATVLAILALGIGMASTMAAVSDAVLRRPLPVVAPERVVALWPTREGTEISLMPDDLERLRHDSRTMRAIAGFVHWGAVPYAVTDGDRPLVLPQSRVTGNFFDVLGTRPVLGRLLRPEDDVAGASPVIVLSYATWRRDFGGDPAVLGRRLHLSSFALDVTVVGVAPPGLDYPLGTAYWAPYATTGQGPVDLVARLAPGATPSAAGTELLAIMRRLHPELALSGADVRGIAEAIVGRVRPALLVLTAAVALLLLIACVNVGSLLLLRASGRAREIAVRRAIGASTGDIVRQLVVESAMLGLAGGVVGAGVAAALLRVMSARALGMLPRGDVVVAAGTPVALSAGVTLLTVLLCGVLPALAGARGAPASPLRLDARSGSGSRARRRARAWLVASQVALALVMLAGAGLLGRSLARLEGQDLGYRADGLQFFQVTFPLTRFDTPAKYTPMLDRVAERNSVLPAESSLPSDTSTRTQRSPCQLGWRSGGTRLAASRSIHRRSRTRPAGS